MGDWLIAVKKKDEKQATRFLDYVRYPLTIGDPNPREVSNVSRVA